MSEERSERRPRPRGGRRPRRKVCSFCVDKIEYIDYKDINRLAFKLLPPGGVLLTFSCSGGISADLFHKIVAGAGLDADADGYITERLGAAPDHPMTIEFPEGEYLKGLACQV